MGKAVGLIEALGLTTAVTALDAASKAADVTLIGFEKVIGVGKAVGVNIQIARSSCCKGSCRCRLQLAIGLSNIFIPCNP